MSEESTARLTEELSELEKELKYEREHHITNVLEQIDKKIDLQDLDSPPDENFQKEMELIAENSLKGLSFLERKVGKLKLAIFEQTPLLDLKAQQEQLEKELNRLPEIKNLNGAQPKSALIQEQRRDLTDKIDSIKMYLMSSEGRKRKKEELKIESSIGTLVKVGLFVMLGIAIFVIYVK